MTIPAQRRPTLEEWTAGVHAALIRAGRRARRETAAAGVPCWVVIDGKLVDLNATPRKRPKRRKAAKPARRTARPAGR